MDTLYARRRGSHGVHVERLINEIVGQMTATLEHGKKHVKWYTKEVNEALFHQPYSRAKMMAML